jgi:hypothetical protein
LVVFMPRIVATSAHRSRIDDFTRTYQACRGAFDAPPGMPDTSGEGE